LRFTSPRRLTGQISIEFLGVLAGESNCNLAIRGYRANCVDLVVMSSLWEFGEFS
jgi:hypothetical protein